MHGIWQDEAQRESFWNEFETLLTRYPEIMNGLDQLYDHGEACECGHEYDKESMKFFSGMVIVLACKNMNDDEGVIVLDPRSQSGYLTVGLLKKGLEYS